MKNKELKAQMYNIHEDDLLELYKKAEQRCQICGRPEETMTRSLAIDHDHKTGKVRGLLCHQCNRGLAHYRDNPELLEAAAKYLRNSAELEYKTIDNRPAKQVGKFTTEASRAHEKAKQQEVSKYMNNLLSNYFTIDPTSQITLAEFKEYVEKNNLLRPTGKYISQGDVAEYIGGEVKRARHNKQLTLVLKGVKFK